jgi:hypothetical protein
MHKIATKWNGFFFICALLSLVLSISSCFSPRKSIAIEEGWELLGETKVNFVRDVDLIDVTSRNQFIGLRFKVEGRDVRLHELKVHFDNGDKLDPAIDLVILAGQESRIIELAREGRTIDKIEFKYRTTGSVLEGRANVLVFGQRYNPGY